MNAPAVRGTRAVVDVRHALDHITTRTGEAMVAMRDGQDARTALWDVVNHADLVATHARSAIAALDAEAWAGAR